MVCDSAARTRLAFFVLCILPSFTSGLLLTSMNRKRFFQRLTGIAALTAGSLLPRPAHSLAFQPSHSSSASSVTVNGSTPPQSTVAYKSLSLPLEDFGVNVPVACWFPVDSQTSSKEEPQTAPQVLTSYQHRISVRRIGELLAGWNFIPEFASRQFALKPAALNIADGRNLPIPAKGPVVLLAHGYLGSRFDLSHLAEKLAAEGFICLSAEYPESLAASYERLDGLARNRINQQLLKTMSNDWKIQATSYGIVGHSLGCGTAIQTGDESWARVCIAGFPRQQDGRPIPGNVLFLTSMNDGAVSLSRFGGKQAIPSDYAMLEEESMRSAYERLPGRAALVFDRPDAPNHISFLSEGVNDAMIELLSPLLPVAQAMNIPVLDFDRYQISRDSAPTAEVVHPLVIRYLKEQMM